MKKRQIVQSAICFALAGILCALSLIFAVPALTAESTDSPSRAGIVRLWNIDTFEGGKGSRTAFLNRVSAAYEKKHESVYIMVSSYTAEGAVAALKEGNFPDMISFGIGFSEAAEKCRKINSRSFAGGLVGKECRAMPWCRGGYALFSLENGFDAADAANTVVSSGGNNLPLVAAALYPFEGIPAVEDSTSAYVRFLSGKYKYLLGTQRDICRFASRGVNVYCRPVNEFSDLYQYIGVLTDDEALKGICEDYIDALLSEETQKKLTEIGMLSPYFDIYSADNSAADELEKAGVRYTLNVFTSDSGMTDVETAARETLTGGNAEVLKNFLKAI